jgi:hypothetical protein
LYGHLADCEANFSHRLSPKRCPWRLRLIGPRTVFPSDSLRSNRAFRETARLRFGGKDWMNPLDREARLKPAVKETLSWAGGHGLMVVK